jgi:8-oxo-dGTP pyrophosphatase MutT (NUDIX family)
MPLFRKQVDGVLSIQLRPPARAKYELPKGLEWRNGKTVITSVEDAGKPVEKEVHEREVVYIILLVEGKVVLMKLHEESLGREKLEWVGTNEPRALDKEMMEIVSGGVEQYDGDHQSAVLREVLEETELRLDKKSVKNGLPPVSDIHQRVGKKEFQLFGTGWYAHLTTEEFAALQAAALKKQRKVELFDLAEMQKDAVLQYLRPSTYAVLEMLSTMENPFNVQ